MREPRSPASKIVADRNPSGLTVSVTPAGRLVVAMDDSMSIAADVPARIDAAFRRGVGAGLLQLGAAEVTTPLPAPLGFWRDFAARFVTAVCARGEDTTAPIEPLGDTLAAELAASVPAMTGGEYVNAAVLASHWQLIDDAFGQGVVRQPRTLSRLRSWPLELFARDSLSAVPPALRPSSSL